MSMRNGNFSAKPSKRIRGEGNENISIVYISIVWSFFEGTTFKNFGDKYLM